MKGSNKRRVATRSTVIAALLLALGNVFADEVLEEESTFDIADQPLDQALLEFSRQADVQIIMAAETARGLDAEAIHGTQRNRDALEQLLADRGLEYSEHSNRTIAVHRTTAVAAEGGDSDSGNRAAAGATPMVMAQSQTGAQQRQASQPNERESEREKLPIEEIVVTGTNIRGIAPESSPVRIFTREDIHISGAATAQDFIRTLTANFGGGASEFGSGPGNGQAGGNNSLGAGVNLRGLGSGSTLVLLNGRRIAPSSTIGGFVDISMIPASAIERVEVMTDGASSIYGGDAVAGVINFVLRRDYDGIEASLRYGTVTEGNMDEYRASLTGGKNWDSGNGLLVYEYYTRDNLDSSDRAFSEDFLSPNDLAPTQERHSVIGSLTQELGPNLEIGADILYSRRDSLKTRTLLTGSRTGNLFVSESGSDNLNIGTILSWHVTDDWYFDLAGVFSSVNQDFASFLSGEFSDTVIDNADLWSIDGKASGTLLELPSGPLKLAVGGHFRSETFSDTSEEDGIRRDGDRDVYAVFGEAFIPIVGPDNAFPGVHRLEINVSGRYEDYSDFGSKATPKVGLLWAPTDRLNLRGSYSASFKPPTIGQTGALDRGVGVVSTSTLFPLFGVTTADPSIADVVILYAFGTSSSLEAETSRAFTGGVDYTADSGPHNFSLSSTYFDIVFENRISNTPVPNNVNDLIAFNIGFDSPELFPDGTFIFFPTVDEVDDFLDSLILSPTIIGDVDPTDAGIIDFVGISRNLSRTVVRGVDFEVLYSLDANFGLLTLGLGGTYLIDFTQQASATTPVVVQRLDTQFNPLDFNLRGRVGYALGGFNANLFINYADDYQVDNTAAAEPIDSWTTVGATVSYDTGARLERPILDHTIFRLSVQNLFNEDPPSTLSVPGIGLLGYDPTNASPIGRFISFEVTKRF